MLVAVYAKESLRGDNNKKIILDGLKKTRNFDFAEVTSLENGTVPQNAEKLLVFGGDGTMLYAATHSELPIMGINLGNVGFLAEFETSSEITDLADNLRYGRIMDRTLLKVSAFDKGGRPLGEFLALNEVVLKNPSSRPITLALSVGGEYVDSYHSDGIMVATPTGSTGYSLSAGGPILAPDVDAFVINPVCPHSLHSRPIVVSADTQIKITAKDAATLVTDGNVNANLDEGTYIVVEKSERHAAFLIGEKYRFFEKLYDKMNRWGTTR